MLNSFGLIDELRLFRVFFCLQQLSSSTLSAWAHETKFFATGKSLSYVFETLKIKRCSALEVNIR